METAPNNIEAAINVADAVTVAAIAKNGFLLADLPIVDRTQLPCLTALKWLLNHDKDDKTVTQETRDANATKLLLLIPTNLVLWALVGLDLQFFAPPVRERSPVQVSCRKRRFDVDTV